MSQGSGSGPATVADYEGGMQENQLAVWLRNVPTWLDEDRFFEEIEGWLDVDKDKSHCFKNKQDSNWVGIRYGWAIVTFKSKRARNKYLEDEDRHFVRETENSPYEKLKVSPWFDKPKAKQPNKSEKINKIPLYKSDLEKEVNDQTYLTVEEFTRGCTDTSIQVFKGRVSSYIPSQAGQPGHVGDLEILLSHGKAELVIFHSDSVWLPDHTGTADSPVRCGVDNFLEKRLQVGADVWFTARRLPAGMVEGRRFQAKSVWQGSDSAHPSFVTPPPARQLDLFLQDYTSEVGRSRAGSKAATPDSESSGAGSTVSPLPQATTTTVRPRPKPLKGGLNQLNSSQEKSKAAPTLKKPVPTNFAQAVSAVPTLIREEHSNLTLALGFVETISSDVEATVSIPDHGNFSLHINHLDLGYKLSQPIGRYLSPKVTTLTVTLKQIKPVASGKPKYELVRAHINEDKKPNLDKFDPFTQDYKSKKSSPVAAVDTWEDLADAEAPNDNQEHSTEFEIDLDELDQYYDDLQGIIEYLEKELPKVIPRIANDEKCFQTLANKLLSHTRGHTDEAKELQSFLDNYPVSARIKNIFISEYVKFRSKNVEEVSTVSADSREKITTFLNWLKTVVKNKDLLNQKIDLYTKILENNWVVLSAWQEVVKEKEDQNFLTFINKSKLGEEGLTQFRSKLHSLIQSNGSGRERLDWGTVVTWLESDTNNFRLEGTKSNQAPIINTESAESSLKFFKIYETSNFEKEFLKHQDKAKETTVFIVRAIVLLRKSEIKFEGLHKLHLRHLEENPKPRNRELIVKITSILNKQSSQKMLDDINATIQRRLRRDTAISYRRFDKYIHILAQSLANFFNERYESRPVKLGSWAGEREKIQRKQETEVKVEEPKDKKSSAVDSADQSENFSDIDYVGLKNFLELSVASGRVRLPSTATIEAIIWTFRAANIPHCRLEAVYNQCREVGGCSWQLQVSQLGLNPPLGLAVPDLAEYLSAYFGSLKNTSIGPVGEDDLELLAEMEDDEEDGEDVEEEDVVVEGELEEYREPELFDLTSCWPGRELLEMQKMFVFSELGGMTRPLLRSNWATGLNTSDLEKERILNQTFEFFQSDRETLSMIEFITPCVERAGLRNAMKVLNQHYPGQTTEQQESELDQNDTDSEKRQSMTEEGEEEAGKVRKSKSSLARNRQLSTDTIKDETLWLAETNLEQLWADEAEQGKGERMLDLQEEEDLAEVSNDSEEYFEDENSSAKEVKQLGAIGSSKPKAADVSRSSSNGVEETSQSSGRAAADKESGAVRAEQSELVQRAGRVEEAVCNLSAWQPMASDIISGNRDLIVQLASRVEYLESALNQLTLSLATQGGVVGRDGGGRESVEARKGGGGRSYVRIVKEGAEEEVAEVPTNSAGLLPHTTVLALYEGTSAIKYRLSGSGPGRLGAWRALLLEDECYHPPEEGWGEREYICTAPQLPAPAPPDPPLQFGLGATSLASPFLGLPPLQHIWGTPGLAANSQTTGSVSQSVFGNMQNMGALNSLGGGGSLQKNFPSNAGKK